MGTTRKNEKFSDLDNIECLVRATEEKVTVGIGQGYGLYTTRRFIEKNLGELHIYSDEGYIFIKDGRLITQQLNSPWEGTIVALTIYKDNDVDIYDVFETDNISSLPSGYADKNIDDSFTLW